MGSPPLPGHAHDAGPRAGPLRPSEPGRRVPRRQDHAHGQPLSGRGVDALAHPDPECGSRSSEASWRPRSEGSRGSRSGHRYVRVGEDGLVGSRTSMRPPPPTRWAGTCATSTAARSRACGPCGDSGSNDSGPGLPYAPPFDRRVFAFITVLSVFSGALVSMEPLRSSHHGRADAAPPRGGRGASGGSGVPSPAGEGRTAGRDRGDRRNGCGTVAPGAGLRPPYRGDGAPG
jgi:hypothetical protein